MTSREIVEQVYEAMKEKGYDPIGQIVGYLQSEDPTYITKVGNIREVAGQLDRDAFLRELVAYYLHVEE